jgi:choline dehydrogenase-like flavoprotein
MIDLLRRAGARYVFGAVGFEPSESRHVFGTLRAGTDPRASVCRRDGRFHDVGNLYCADGTLFPTSSGYNPILTIAALGGWVGASMLTPEAPGRGLGMAWAGPPPPDHRSGGPMVARSEPDIGPSGRCPERSERSLRLA